MPTADGIVAAVTAMESERHALRALLDECTAERHDLLGRLALAADEKTIVFSMANIPGGRDLSFIEDANTLAISKHGPGTGRPADRTA